MRFWLYQKPDGRVATVFDACEICGSAGFYKGPNGVVCRNCAAPINGQSVGTKGGCNPVPLRPRNKRRRNYHHGGGHRGGRALVPAIPMFVRLVYESFRRQKRRKLLAGIAIALGVGVATAMIAVATDIGDKINRELRGYGANLIVTPQEDTLDVQIGGVNLKPPSDGAYLNEADLPKIKGMFWRNNILGFAPTLPVNVEVAGNTENVTLLGTYFAKPLQYGKETFVTGVRTTDPWWRVQGILAGRRLGRCSAGTGFGGKTGDAGPADQLEIAGTARRVVGVLVDRERGG